VAAVMGDGSCSSAMRCSRLKSFPRFKQSPVFCVIYRVVTGLAKRCCGNHNKHTARLHAPTFAATAESKFLLS